MDALINNYLESCLSVDSELKKKILILKKRGYSLDITDDYMLMINAFSLEKDKEYFLNFFNLPKNNGLFETTLQMPGNTDKVHFI